MVYLQKSPINFKKRRIMVDFEKYLCYTTLVKIL